MHLTLAALAVAAMALAPASGLGRARAAIEAEEWPKARKALKRAASPTASAEAISEIALLRALTEAADGQDRRADWYWWVAKMFGPASETWGAEEDYPAAFARLKDAVRPSPEVMPLDPNIDLSRLQGVRRKPGGRPPSVQKACAGFKGVVVFEAITGDRGFYQAPRWSAQHQNSAPPACAFAVLEAYRDAKGKIPGGANVIKNRF